MSNRENLRRIAALSLVIAFGMSGAAGLADAVDEPSSGIVVPQTEPELKIADKATALGFIVEDNTCTYNMELSNGKAEFEFAPFWSFVLNDKEITDLSIDPALEESDFGYKVSFDKADTYTYTIKATGYDAPVLTLKFVVTEAEAPKTEPELKIADKATALGFIVEDNTCTYNMELSDGKAEFEFAPFWSFVLNDKEIADLSIDPALEESDFGYKVSFDKADTYTYTIKATGYDAPVLTLKFVVTEAEAPKTEPELKIADKATALGFIVEDNTCTYNMELSDGKAEFEFAPFWSFVLNDKEITDLSIDPALEESDFGYKVSFDKADTYTYTIKATGYACSCSHSEVRCY